MVDVHVQLVTSLKYNQVMVVFCWRQEEITKKDVSEPFILVLILVYSL